MRRECRGHRAQRRTPHAYSSQHAGAGAALPPDHPKIIFYPGTVRALLSATLLPRGGGAPVWAGSQQVASADSRTRRAGPSP
ncbi:hypothetical protein EVAR_5425_1 [Eumeta japonica]|uniref:Uncharacterized protein n=1 Tax=Eumeta variegata TaxID=151549 RepID=A0A4C1T8K3_EUMVA|nr:hypothetical protein EVAR_5425_1 [Eumeta japonica]